MFQHRRPLGESSFSRSREQQGLTSPRPSLVAGRVLASALLALSASACVTSNDSEKPAASSPGERERRAEVAGIVDSEHLDGENAAASKAKGPAASTAQKPASAKHPQIPPAPSLSKQTAADKTAAAKPSAAPAKAAKSEPQPSSKADAKLTATAPVASAPSVPATQPVTPANSAQSVAASTKVKQTRRTVSVQALNVRSQPNTQARIVGRLTRGTQLPVAIEGHWAKIGENQYVLAKFLRSGR